MHIFTSLIPGIRPSGADQSRRNLVAAWPWSLWLLGPERQGDVYPTRHNWYFLCLPPSSQPSPWSQAAALLAHSPLCHSWCRLNPKSVEIWLQSFEGGALRSHGLLSGSNFPFLSPLLSLKKWVHPSGQDWPRHSWRECMSWHRLGQVLNLGLNLTILMSPSFLPFLYPHHLCWGWMKHKGKEVHRFRGWKHGELRAPSGSATPVQLGLCSQNGLRLSSLEFPLSCSVSTVDHTPNFTLDGNSLNSSCCRIMQERKFSEEHAFKEEKSSLGYSCELGKNESEDNMSFPIHCRLPPPYSEQCCWKAGAPFMPLISSCK